MAKSDIFKQWQAAFRKAKTEADKHGYGDAAAPKASYTEVLALQAMPAFQAFLKGLKHYQLQIKCNDRLNDYYPGQHELPPENMNQQLWVNFRVWKN